ncbi:Uncharacterised protein [Nocardia africana]|uniref:Uncharacterized protein n=1 Tax=Nocardia africana TaxID=134964 RepID=A0A378WMJ9_9NOCA|nr:Uncharacterised protein [Nocardia africana]
MSSAGHRFSVRCPTASTAQESSRTRPLRLRIRRLPASPRRPDLHVHRNPSSDRARMQGRTAHMQGRTVRHRTVSEQLVSDSRPRIRRAPPRTTHRQRPEIRRRQVDPIPRHRVQTGHSRLRGHCHRIPGVGRPGKLRLTELPARATGCGPRNRRDRTRPGRVRRAPRRPARVLRGEYRLRRIGPVNRMGRGRIRPRRRRLLPARLRRGRRSRHLRLVPGARTSNRRCALLRPTKPGSLPKR